MKAVRIETIVENDGELHLRQLPLRRGDKVEAIVLLLETPSGTGGSTDELARAAALQRFLTQAKASRFCSAGPYPSREELHERL